MISITHIKNYCQDYQNIENYEEAVKSPLRYDLHHRREISENKSRKQLIAENLYYGRPPEELIFIEAGEHIRLHQEGKRLSVETRKRMSDAKKGEKSYMYGKHPSAETKRKISENNSRYWKGKLGPNRGKHFSQDTRQKMSEAKKNMSAETRQKMSEAKKNMSAETRQKMSEAKKGKLKGLHWHLENGHRIWTE